jgi:hypothetical protein
MTDETRTQDGLIRGLLGPTDAEVGCDECFERLDRFVELEIAGAEPDETIPGVRAHLEGCPACQEDYLSLRALVEADG